MTKEHAEPRWFRKLKESLESVPQDKPVIVKICRTCNETSNELFEKPVKSIISRLANGEPATIVGHDRRNLAQWNLKTNMMCLLAGAQWPHSAEIRNLVTADIATTELRNLFAKRNLPAGLVVRLIHADAHNTSPNPLVPDITFSPPANKPPLALNGFLGAGQMGAQLLLPYQHAFDRGRDFLNSMPSSEYFSTVWPPILAEVPFPPSKSMTYRQAFMLQALWSGGQVNAGSRYLPQAAAMKELHEKWQEFSTPRKIADPLIDPMRVATVESIMTRLENLPTDYGRPTSASRPRQE